MGVGVFRAGHLVAFCGVAVPAGLAREGDELIEAAGPDEALAAFDTLHGTQLSAAAAKRAEVEAWYQQAIDAGFDTGLGFSMSLAEADQRYLMDHLLGLQATVPVQQRASALDALKDREGQSHVLTVADSIELLKAGYSYVRQLLALKFGYEMQIAAGDFDFVPGS